MPNNSVGTQARIFKNGIYSALSWVFPIIFAFVATPVVVRGLGDELYGLYAVILGFISYSFTFGIGKTAAKYVSEYKATGEFAKISETVSAALWLSLGIGIIGAAIVALTANYIVSNILLIPPPLPLNRNQATCRRPCAPTCPWLWRQPGSATACSVAHRPRHTPTG